jgi:hypothetical protein
MKLIDLERLKELLDYDPETGLFKWKVHLKYSPRYEGDLAGYNNEGYVKITIDGLSYRAHHLAWFITTGNWPKLEIDHINGDKSDNSISNLRDVTRIVNMHNKGEYKNNKTGYTGVHWYPRYEKFAAQIRTNGKCKTLGYFETAEEAHEAYQEAKLKQHPSAFVKERMSAGLELPVDFSEPLSLKRR